MTRDQPTEAPVRVEDAPRPTTARLVENDTEIFIDGDFYMSVLREIHLRSEPKSYFEIGALFGDTLRQASCPAVAVDPHFQLRQDAPLNLEQVTLREMTSDDYFASHDPIKDLGRSIDLAFLDGMHEFPFLLRDFINTEKYCHRRSIIAMHDCIPLDCHMTRLFRDMAVERPTNHPGCWAGDVWKMIPVLRRYRPDLEISCLNAAPTGLAICRNVDPHSTVLADNYDAILAEWETVRLEDFGIANLFAAARIQPVEAWLPGLRRFHGPNRLRQLRAALRPRRRILQAISALGLTRPPERPRAV